MKIVVIGVGAVGGYFGAKLCAAGFDVSFIARQKTFDALQKDGLFVESVAGNIHLPAVKVFDSYAIVEQADLVILCTKTYDGTGVVETIKPLFKPKAIILPFQNGIENMQNLIQSLGTDHLLVSVIYLLGRALRPGYIMHNGLGKVVIGENSGQITQRVQDVLDIFQQAGIPMHHSEKIFDEMWSKYMINVTQNGMTALLENSLYNYARIPELQDCFKQALLEIQHVAKLEGCTIHDEVLNKFFDYSCTSPDFGKFKPSTLQDIEARKPTEIDEINGAFVRFAQKHNASIPINKFLYALLRAKYDL